MSRRFHNFHNRKQVDSRNKTFNFKWSIIWVLIHFASLFLLTLGIQQLSLNNGLIIVFLIGLGVTIISRIVRTFTLKKRFIVDKWFFFWSLINTFTIWLILLLKNLLQITNQLLALLFMSIGLVIIAYFVKKLRIRRTAMIISSIILIVILFFFNSNSSNLIDTNTQVVETQASSVKSNNLLSNIKDSISKLFSSISLDTCPQLPMRLGGQGIMYDLIEEHTESCPTQRLCVFYGEYHPTNSVSKLTSGIWISPSAYILCRDAKYEGENRNYLYCDLGRRSQDPGISMMNNMFSETSDTIPYIVKKPKEQGEIIEKQKLVRKSFMNIYEQSIDKDYDPIIDKKINSECAKYDYNSHNITFEFKVNVNGTIIIRTFQCGKDEFKYKYKYIFKETVCGPDPDEVQRQRYEKVKKEIKDTMGGYMRELDDWFDVG